MRHGPVLLLGCDRIRILHLGVDVARVLPCCGTFPHPPVV
jgi:hypothetical protein